MFLLLLCLITANAEARWATKKDVDSVLDFQNSVFKVNADATYSVVIESQTQVLKESARSQFSRVRLTYNSRTSQLKVLEAKTIHRGKEYPVDLKFIEDKPLASPPKGFDQKNQVMVAFPRVEIGSKIYIKYERTIKEPAIDGLFSMSFVYGSGMLEKAGLVEIFSEQPIYLKKNDLKRVLDIRKKKKTGKHYVSIELTQPVHFTPVDENFVYVDPKTYPWVEVSTSNSWDDMAQPMIHKYEAVFSQELPEVFNDIVLEAKKKKTEEAKINTVTSELASMVAYMGDWRPVQGGYVPRNLDMIAQTKFGDCKDFSAATVAILRKAGLKADVAWVRRGVGSLNSPVNLPRTSAFNHAIVKVTGSQKTYWVDPTNFASFATGIYSDIADRQALVLYPYQAKLEYIPAIQPGDNSAHVDREFKFSGDQKVAVSGRLKLTGNYSLKYTGASLKASERSIDYSLIKVLGDEDRISSWEVQPYDLSSRVVEDLEFTYTYKEEDAELKTSAGPAFRLPTGALFSKVLTKTTDRVSDLYLGNPYTLQKDYRLRNVKMVGDKPLTCSVKSDWFKAYRTVKPVEDGVDVSENVTLLKPRISNRMLRTPDFKKLQEQINQCFYGVYIVYQYQKADTREISSDLSP